jgi:hypothetical protein
VLKEYDFSQLVISKEAHTAILQMMMSKRERNTALPLARRNKFLFNNIAEP